MKGEDNPADLLTKHSLTRERLIALTKLDCQFRGGRAEAAPKIRIAPGIKVTMAEAHAVTEDAVPADPTEGEIIMPHLHYDEETLKFLHPPLEVPEAVDMDDPLNDRRSCRS